MKVRIAVFASLAWLTAGCELLGQDDRPSDPATATAPASTAPTNMEGSSSAQTERRADIYSAVIRRLVVQDHTFGGGDPGFRVVYVFDGAVKGAEKARPSSRPRRPRTQFGAELEAAIEERLQRLPPITFVHHRGSVLREGEVRNRGVLVTLGPIDGGRRRAEVGCNLWISGRGALWVTYVVRMRSGGWRVTGVTGGMTIA